MDNLSIKMNIYMMWYTKKKNYLREVNKNIAAVGIKNTWCLLLIGNRNIMMNNFNYIYVYIYNDYYVCIYDC